MNVYDKGDLIRCAAEFTNSSGTAVDPDVVVFKMQDPSGNVTTYTYGVDDELVKGATGNYHVDVDGDEAGEFVVRWESTGAGQAADEMRFYVDESEFD